MNEVLNFVTRHGELVLFMVVFIEQLGAPLPAPLFLLGAGGLIGQSRMNGLAAITAWAPWCRRGPE